MSGLKGAEGKVVGPPVKRQYSESSMATAIMYIITLPKLKESQLTTKVVGLLATAQSEKKEAPNDASKTT